jgi:hypothetical protein
VSGSRRSDNTDTELGQLGQVGQADEGQNTVRQIGPKPLRANGTLNFGDSNQGRRRSQSVRTQLRCASSGSLRREIRRSASGGKNRLRRTFTAKLRRTATVTIVQVQRANNFKYFQISFETKNYVTQFYI